MNDGLSSCPRAGVVFFDLTQLARSMLSNLTKPPFSTQRVFLLFFRGAASCWRPLSSRPFWARPMPPARRIWRPTAAHTFV